MLSSFRKVSGRLGRYLPAVALLAGAAPYAQAQAWRFDPRLQVDGIYNDNFRLTDQPGQEIEVTGGALDGALTISKQGQRVGILAHAAHPLDVLSGRWSPRNRWITSSMPLGTMQTRRSHVRGSICASRTRVSSRRSCSHRSFPVLNLGETVSGDAGRVSVRNRRRLIVFQPSTRFDWTERRHIELTAHYADASYDDEFFEQVGYSDVGVSGAIEWNVTPRSLLRWRIGTAFLIPTARVEPTTTHRPHLEWRSSPQASSGTVYARIGANHSGTGCERLELSSARRTTPVAWASPEPPADAGGVPRMQLRSVLGRARRLPCRQSRCSPRTVYSPCSLRSFLDSRVPARREDGTASTSRSQRFATASTSAGSARPESAPDSQCVADGRIRALTRAEVRDRAPRRNIERLHAVGRLRAAPSRICLRTSSCPDLQRLSWNRIPWNPRTPPNCSDYIAALGKRRRMLPVTSRCRSSRSP